MFSSKELSIIDSQYFQVIQKSALCVTIVSKNTGHFWHIIHQEYPSFKSCEIWHKHKAEDQYHLHGHKGTLRAAINSVKSHDIYQLNHRKPVRKKSNLA